MAAKRLESAAETGAAPISLTAFAFIQAETAAGDSSWRNPVERTVKSRSPRSRVAWRPIHGTGRCRSEDLAELLRGVSIPAISESNSAQPIPMNTKAQGLFWLALTVSILAGCASKPPEPTYPDPNLAHQPSASSRAKPKAIVRKPPASRDGVGGYSAPFMSGDFAGYPELDRFIDRMSAEHGFSREYLNGLFSQAQRKQWTLEYMNREAPSTKPRPGAWSRYRAKFLTEQHISRGAAFWMRHASALERVKREYGVPPEYVIGILGVETIYGSNVGRDRVLDALTTLAFDYPRRAGYFTEELENFLLMSRDERIDPSSPRGSFAGAMGLGQFMPSSFRRWAVDFDRDGRRDLWEPVDAIGSVANYFAEHGWREGERVVAPAIATSPEANLLDSGFDTHYSLSALAGYGIRPGSPIRAGSDGLRLLRLSTNGGEEYWLGFQNFYVITRYNHSTHYAMAVHELAQAVKDRYQNSMSASRD